METQSITSLDSAELPVDHPDTQVIHAPETAVKSNHGNNKDNNHNNNNNNNHDDTIDKGNENIAIPGSTENENIEQNLTPIITNKSLKVPNDERRGLFAKLSLLPEYEDPRNYSDRTKNFIVSIVAFAAICGPLGTSIILPAIDDVVKDLNTQVILVNVSVGIYTLALGILPLWWSSFSEKYGRRSIYIVSFTLFVGFSIGAALAPNISSLIIFRVLCGGSSASVQAVGAGSIGDLFPPHQRGKAMGYYYLGPLLGPFLAPIIGGAVAQAWGWRATQWVLVIVAVVADFFVIFTLPETLRKQDNLADIRKLLQQLRDQQGDSTDEKIEEEGNDEQHEQPRDSGDAGDSEESEHNIPLQQVQTYLSEISRNELREDQLLDYENEIGVGDSIAPSLARLDTSRSNYSKKVALEELSKKLSNLPRTKKEKFQSYKDKAYQLLIRPLHALVLLTYPPVILVISHSAICFAAIFFVNLTISYEYSRSPYNFSSVIVGLLYIPNSVGYILASIIGGRWNDRLLKKYASTHNGELRPESRISWNITLATIMYIPGCLVFGWTIRYGLHWVIPLIGTAIFGFASMLVIGATVTYLVDTLPGKGATGVALNNLIRQVLAAIATFIVEPLIKALKPGILYSIIIGIILVSSLSLVYLKKYGDKLRTKYDIGEFYDKL